MSYIRPPAPDSVPWYSGPPPEIGWWPASTIRNPTMLRYWDGKCWSKCIYHTASAFWTGDIAIQKADHQDKIEWSPRWWI